MTLYLTIFFVLFLFILFFYSSNFINIIKCKIFYNKTSIIIKKSLIKDDIESYTVLKLIYGDRLIELEKESPLAYYLTNFLVKIKKQGTIDKQKKDKK